MIRSVAAALAFILPTLAVAASGQTTIVPVAITSASIASSLPAEILVKGHYQVTSTEVLLRAAPRANAAVQLTLKKGDRLNLMGVQNDTWAKVKLESGRIGYLYATSIQSVASLNAQKKEKNIQSIRNNSRLQKSRVTIQPRSAISSSASSDWVQIVEPTVTADVRMVTSPNLNLRMDARATSYLLKTLHNGEKVSVLQWLDNGWVLVKSGNVEGYVMSQFLSK